MPGDRRKRRSAQARLPARSLAAFDNDSPYEGDEGISELNRQSCRLGIRAIRLSRELRRICAMPEDELSAHHWSAWRSLSNQRARIIEAELRYGRGRHRTIDALKLLNSAGPDIEESVSS